VRRAVLSRRDVLRLSALAAAGFSRVARASAADKPATTVGADEALARLLEGNKRYVEGNLVQPRRRPEDFKALAEGQAPLAVIVACADSRVAPDLLFDQGVGDLFVVRVAGNVVSSGGPAVTGSIEYAVAELGVRLVMVLGHSQCGAVKAAIKHLEAKDALPGSIGELVDAIKPAVLAAKRNPGDLLDNAIKANVERGVTRLKGLEPILAGAVRLGKVRIVGANYDLRTGKVMVLA